MSVETLRLPAASGAHILQRIVAETHLPIGVLAEHLRWDASRLAAALVGSSSESLEIAARLATFCNISLDQVYRGRVDFRFMRSSIRASHTQLPDRYLITAFSSIRTITNVLNYLTRSFGQTIADHILSRLQLHRNMFVELGQKVNQTLSIEIAEEASRFLRNPTLPRDLGRNAVGILRSLADLSQPIISAPEAIDYFFSPGGVAEKVETNRYWNIITIGPERALIEAQLNPETLGAIAPKYMFSSLAEDIRLGYLDALPAIFGLPNAQTKQILFPTEERPSALYSIHY